MSDHSYMEDWKNKTITKNLRGQKDNKFHVLAGKKIEFNNRSIWLLSADGEEAKYSLWIFEPAENGSVNMWPYEGTDTEVLITELLEDYMEHAFDVFLRHDTDTMSNRCPNQLVPPVPEKQMFPLICLNDPD